MEPVVVGTSPLLIGSQPGGATPQTRLLTLGCEQTQTGVNLFSKRDRHQPIPRQRLKDLEQITINTHRPMQTPHHCSVPLDAMSRG